jgi:hypothetical protein
VLLRGIIQVHLRRAFNGQALSLDYIFAPTLTLCSHTWRLLVKLARTFMSQKTFLEQNGAILLRAGIYFSVFSGVPSAPDVCRTERH